MMLLHQPEKRSWTGNFSLSIVATTGTLESYLELHSRGVGREKYTSLTMNNNSTSSYYILYSTATIGLEEE